ncbi:hypothetical protein LCGC14_2729600 [marine sediment metagenome]|uniref:Uncharacterized protein n=1 Tax=marine sediment metagenome TaxID=412755 RepID=A0A0F8Z7T7_9ZZZZ
MGTIKNEFEELRDRINTRRWQVKGESWNESCAAEMYSIYKRVRGDGRKDLLDEIVEYLEGAAEQCRLHYPQHTQAYRMASTVVARLLDEEAKR